MKHYTAKTNGDNTKTVVSRDNFIAISTFLIRIEGAKSIQIQLRKLE